MNNNNVVFEDFRSLEDKSLHILEATPLPILISKIDGGITFVNSALLAMLGYSNDEIYRKDVIITHPDDINENINIRTRLVNSPQTKITVEKRYKHKNGSTIYGLLTIAARPSTAGEVTHFISQIVDITDKKVYQNDMQLFKALVEKSNDGMVIFCAQTGTLLNANRSFCDNLGYTLDEVKSMHVQEIEQNMPQDFKWQRFIASVRQKGNIIYEGLHKAKSGELLNVEVSISYAALVTGNFITAIIRDISERKRKDEMIWFQANYDALTKLPNRYMFSDRLEQEIIKTDRNNLMLGILCLDVDNFKDVNDSLGHHNGDKLLIEIAMRIKSCIRQSDTVARLGGDEFAIIINHVTNIELIEHIAIKILTKLSEPVKLELETVYVSASIGIAMYPQDGKTPDDLLKDADHAMYLVKKNGRNGYQYFTKAMHEKAITRIELINDLHHAIKSNQFELVYQPIVNLKTGELVKAEALVRWNHPIKGLISPDQFIPLAEESGLIIEIGAWVFDEVTKQVIEWKKLYSEAIEININMSPIQFNDRDNHILLSWIKYLEANDISGSCFTVEITENAMMRGNDYEDIATKIKLLHKHGIKVALDDFGTGYSSLAHLKRLDIDALKIDRSFVYNLKEDTDNLAVCEAITTMAEKLNLQVVAEGIETQEECDLLKNVGCEFGQGYFFAKPLNANKFSYAFLKKKEFEKL